MTDFRSPNYGETYSSGSDHSQQYQNVFVSPRGSAQGMQGSYGYHGERNIHDDDLDWRNTRDGHTTSPDKGSRFDTEFMSMAGNAGFQLVSVLTQKVLTYPLLVFRNQCQVNNTTDGSYHVALPWSPISPLLNIYRNQGIASLWRGIHNEIIVSGVSRAVEAVISENSSLPLDLNDRPRGSVLGAYMKHGVLKSIGIVVTTPLICAAYVLRVQSQVVVSETNYLSIFSEGYRRILSSLFSYNTETSHLLPLYQLVVPVTTLCLGRYIINKMALATVQRQYQIDSICLNDTEHDEIPLMKCIYDKYYPQLLGALSGQMIADVCLYPLSTITGRLIIQGTRTIIDDVETGNAVLPVKYNYGGVFDCLNSIIKEEGITGLYKGFAAVVMQYAVQALILRGVHLLYEALMDAHHPRVPRRRINSTAMSSTYSSVSSLNVRST